MSPEISASGQSARSERKPLFNEDAERGMLGSILLDWQKVLDFCIEQQIQPESFYLRSHQTIYTAMMEMSDGRKPIDILTLADRLKTQGKLDEIGGIAFLNQLLDATPTAAHAEYYVDLVRQHHLLRRIVDCARQSETECYSSDEDADHILARVEQDFFNISEERHSGLLPWNKGVMETMTTIDRIHRTKKGLSGIPTGYKDLDEKLLGMHNGDMIVLAARPSMGKTSLAMNIVEHVALGKFDAPHAVCIFSLEMSREQLILRMLGSHARIPAHNIAGGFATDAQFGLLAQSADVLMKAPIFLDDTGGLDILELRARARRMKKKENIALFVIDYLQLLHSKDHRREGRQAEIAAISGSIKNMAKELKVPVLVLSQLNRAPEAKEREGKPRLADLRDSGSIEQDADVVCLLRRPILYKDDTKENVDDPNLAYVHIAKQRNGPTGEINLIFLDDIMRFENFAEPARYGTEAPSPATESES
ncbi:MAG: replicative DNA helicase [Verrucomicrobia bacterium]|nr:replicative DNA helicase [Verrucomicrobiota bacterium]MBU4246794.1 replicative DNA helicase [Verrucomicrobiota bacterium]MBU4290572.1 replicative DNA helicase [Verrucomicrobiota bacterium]MBU4496596.1 replicative DNA helicase [Verrucomicrobiota bacterium]MCG2681212.1 replicative DNA helicase [Kiritimatiellia bacterium]